MARKRFNFWLDDRYPGDIELDRLITDLKAPGKGKGKFTRAIREGLRIWIDSAQGGYKVWAALFPKAAAKYLADQQKRMPTPKPPPDTKELEAKIARLEELLLEVTRGTLMIQSTAKPSGLQSLGQGLKASPHIPMPVFDDEEETQPYIPVTKAEVDGLQISRNLVGSMMGLNARVG